LNNNKRKNKMDIRVTLTKEELIALKKMGTLKIYQGDNTVEISTY